MKTQETDQQGRKRTTRVPLAVLAACAGMSLSGCQTADVLETSDGTGLIGGLDLPGEADLASGKAQYRQGNYGLAEKHFRKAVELRAGSAEAWLGLAASYDRLGRFDLADRAYAQVVDIAGRVPRVINNMGYSQLLRGNRDKARKLFFEAQAAMPDDPVIKANIALLDSD